MISKGNNLPLNFSSKNKVYTSKLSPQILRLEEQRFQQLKQNQQSPKQHYVGSSYSNNEQLRQSVNDLMKEMESALDSPKITEEDHFYLKHSKASENSEKNQDKKSLNENKITNNTQILKTSQDGLGMNKIKTLPELQLSIVQQILMLREEKITYLQKRNQIIDKKNQLQRELARIKKKNNKNQNQQSQITIVKDCLSHQETPSQKSLSAKNESPNSKSVKSDKNEKKLQNLQAKNNQLKRQIQQLMKQNQDSLPKDKDLQSIQLEDTKSMLEIQKYSRLCSRIQERINQQQNKDVNRFQTFLPTEKNIHLQSTSSQSSRAPGQKIWKNQTIKVLAAESQRLIKQANQLISIKNKSKQHLSLQILQIINDMNDCIRNAFVQRVKRQKKNLPLIKHYHQHLKSILEK